MPVTASGLPPMSSGWKLKTTRSLGLRMCSQASFQMLFQPRMRTMLGSAHSRSLMAL